MPLSDIVEVTISRETAVVSQTGFGTLNIVGESNNFPIVDSILITLAGDLVTGNVIDVTVNGVAITSTTWAASHVATMGVIAGKIQALSTVATAIVSGGTNRIITVTSNSGDVVIVNSFVVTLGASQTTATIVRTAATRIRSYANLTAVAVDFVTTDLEYIAAAAAFSQSPVVPLLKISDNRAGDATWTDALNAIALEDDEWYGFIITSRTKAEQQLAAAWAETQVKIFGTASNEAAILTSGSTDLAALLNTSDYDRTFLIYHSDADESTNDPFPDASWFGKMLPTDPGSATWMFKTLSGIAVTVLTTTQANFALGKECNTYQEIGGVNITRNGTMSSGEYIDIIRFVDWLESRMTERIFTLLANADKVPFTDPGVASVEAEVRAQLDDGIDQGGLALDPAYTVTVPKVADVSSTDRGNRTLPDVEFTATLAGAIHKVTVTGVVTI